MNLHVGLPDLLYLWREVIVALRSGAAPVRLEHQRREAPIARQGYVQTLQIVSIPKVSRCLMEVTRHNFAVGSPFGNEALFTLRWRGAIAADFSFQLEHQLANLRSTVRVAGRIVDAAD